jgi:hypothetical protein
MIFQSYGRALRLPRKRRALSNGKMSSRPPNVRAWPAATARDIGLEWRLRGQNPSSLSINPSARSNLEGATVTPSGAESTYAVIVSQDVV